MQGLRFIDLFAGLGGFHLALSSLGHECVLACERDKRLAALYKKNFGIVPYGDIRVLELSDVPDHDILCAGFPCQPFSKAGNQQGLDCPQWGNLIDYVVDILRFHEPEFFIMENVPNLVRHRQGETWREIFGKLGALGYEVDDHLLSPHEFGVPQIRKRTFIVGRRGGLGDFSWPTPLEGANVSIHKALDDDPPEAKKLPQDFIAYLKAWQEFLDRFPKDEELPGPIWAMEFGATYPYQDLSPRGAGLGKIGSRKGSFGKPLRGLTEDGVLAALPAYARTEQDAFPEWKVNFIRQNRDLYERHNEWIDDWLPRIRDFAPSFQKFEWNCKGEKKRSLWECIIQFRPSGVRAKRPTTAPSLVAMATSQVPVIAWERRYMTTRECARLQSMDELEYLPETQTAAFNALGNAVNVEVVQAIARQLLHVPPAETQAKPRTAARKRADDAFALTAW